MALQLPPGWAITKTLEVVPNPNATTEPNIGAPYFSRYTYICTDENGQYVCASGSEDDCNSQAQTAAQCRTQQAPYYEATP